MYNNIVATSVAVQRKEYSANGNLVIDVYVQSKAAGKTADQIKADMTKKIEDLAKEGKLVGGGHCTTPEEYAKKNVIDINYDSISNLDKFRKACNKAHSAGTIKFNDEPNNSCFHLEIYQ